MAYGHWINILGVVNGHANLPNGENEVSCSLEQMRGDHDKSCCDGELKVALCVMEGQWKEDLAERGWRA
ncbi:hypothetical protein EJB05_34600, partial [Eragrostis curvula]